MNHAALRRACGTAGLPAFARIVVCLLAGIGAVGAADWIRPGPAGGESTAGVWRLRGAAGQAEAAVVEGGGYRLTGGFWNPLALRSAASPPVRIEGLALAPSAGTPASTLRVRGILESPGSVALRLYWEQDGVLRLVGRGQTGPDGAFDAALVVPSDAAAGAAQIAVLPGDGDSEALASVAFTVVPPAPGRVRGLVRDTGGRAVGAGTGIRLLGADGLPVAVTLTDAVGSFVFTNAPPGPHRVQVMAGGYPPGSVQVASGDDLALQFDPANVVLPEWPPVMLLGVGAVALPGGSYSGKEPVQVGDWNEVPMARLVSLKGKSLAPLQVRFWAEIQRILLPPGAPLAILVELQKDGAAVAPQVLTDTLATVYPDGKLNVPAFTADFNSLELTPGKLVLVVRAFTTGLQEVGRWEFPVDVVDLGKRWYAGHVRNAKLTVTRQDFSQLRYAFEGALPNLPGVGTPLFKEDLKIKWLTLKNEFNLGIKLKETFFSGGGWDGSATALANLTLFGAPILDASKPLKRTGSTLAASKYAFEKPWVHPLGPPILIPVVGGALPKPIEICGFKFGGYVGIAAALGGEVALTANSETDLRLRAALTPGLKVGVPIGASLEFAVCQAVTEVRPEVKVTAPIRLDPWHDPAVYWDGLCLQFSAKAKAGLVCCDDVGLGGFSVDIFPPFRVPEGCGGGAQLQGLGVEQETTASPPRHASVAYSPAGYAMAVWDHWDRTLTGSRVRTAPVYSLFTGDRWTTPKPLAGPEFAGWEPQVGFLDDRRALVVWTSSAVGVGGLHSSPAGPQIQSLDCSLAEPILKLGCSALGAAVKTVEVVVDAFCGVFGCAEPALQGTPAATASELSPPAILHPGPAWDLRPVLATHPPSGEALLVWSREQPSIPGVQGPLALYSSRRSQGVWSHPQRLDPTSAAFDLQPTLRFDAQGRPAAVWVRDLDGDLDSPADRTLVFSRLESAWSAPEPLAPLPPSPWTPSLDFDRDGQPVVAFVVPPRDPDTGAALAADGTLATLQVARRLGREWLAQPVGVDLQAERPVVRIRPDNQALVFFRGFGSPGRARVAGEIASAVANLTEAEPHWNVGPLGAGSALNWNVAAELNPTNGTPLVLWETRDAVVPETESELRGGPQPWAVDLALDESGLGFSPRYPVPGQAAELTVRVVNRGLQPLGTGGFRVDFFDREPERGVLPFASRILEGPLGFGQERLVTVSYAPTSRAWRTFHVVVDPDQSVPESDEANNRAAGAWGGLAAPTDFGAAPREGGGGVRLAWTSPVSDGSVRHWIWRTLLRTGERDLVGATAGHEFLDSTAAANEDYAYRLVASDSAGIASGGGDPAEVRVPAPEPPDPADLRIQVVSFADRITLTWNALPAVQLEAADELAGARTRWRPRTEGVVRFGGLAQITLPAVPSQRFFRLMRL